MRRYSPCKLKYSKDEIFGMPALGTLFNAKVHLMHPKNKDAIFYGMPAFGKFSNEKIHPMQPKNTDAI
jgi:hypothetical protein